MKAATWRKPLANQKTSQEVVGHFVRALVKKFPPFLTRENCILHFDGLHTEEKRIAHAKRLQHLTETYGDHMTGAYRELATVSAELTRIPTTDPPTRKQRRRILGPATRSIEHFKKIRTFSLDPTTTTAIKAALEELGWFVHVCPGESDDCISTLETLIVVTSDSDYLFRGARIVLRKDPKVHTKYTAYVLQDLLDALELNTNEWSAVGVISGNDFADNIRNFAIARNYSIIKAMDTASLGPTEIIHGYCMLMADEQQTVEDLLERFRVAQSVFVDNEETPITDPTQNRRNILELEGELSRVLGDVSGALTRYRASRTFPDPTIKRTEDRKRSRTIRSTQYAVKTVSWDAVASETDLVPVPKAKKRRRKTKSKTTKVARLRMTAKCIRAQTYRTRPDITGLDEHQTGKDDDASDNDSSSSESSVSQSLVEDAESAAALQEDDEDEPGRDLVGDEESIFQESTASAGEEDDTDAMDSDENEDDEEDEDDDEDDDSEEGNEDEDDMDTEAEKEEVASASAPTHMTVQKRPQTLYLKLECHCAIITEELGCLQSIVRRGIFNRYAETSAEQFQDLEQSLLPLAHSAHQFALVAQSTITPHDLLIAAQQAQPAINASKARYVTVMQELERFAPIGQELKTRLLEAAIGYHSALLSHVSLSTGPSSSSIPALENARHDVDAVLRDMKRQQAHYVAAQATVFIQSIVQDMSDRYQYIHLALSMFVAANVWSAEATAKTLEEQRRLNEDLRALLDPARSKSIARLL
ncbi:hypothetical protein EC968_008169, partial [Mortierella alpina]